jgi:hypothetical protein
MNMEKCHYDISEMEKRFSGKWSPNMLAGCSWSLTRETPTGEYKKMMKKKTIMKKKKKKKKMMMMMMMTKKKEKKVF